MSHLSRTFFAGVVAILPIGGTVLTVLWLENSIAASWLADRAYYVPGLGLLVAALIIYGLGLLVTTFLGRWLWSRVDRLLVRVPALGRLYATLKQILGYGDGHDALFRRAVLVQSSIAEGHEIGLVTREFSDANGRQQLVVFVPGSPNPTTGRVVLLDAARTVPIALTVNDALTALISAGSSLPDAALVPSSSRSDHVGHTTPGSLV